MGKKLLFGGKRIVRRDVIGDYKVDKTLSEKYKSLVVFGIAEGNVSKRRRNKARSFKIISKRRLDASLTEILCHLL